MIDQDPLGLGRIYVQAKRYSADSVVGRPAIQEFVGGTARTAGQPGRVHHDEQLQQGGERYARHVNAAVVLVDGRRLTDRMIQYRVGVQIEQTYTVMKVDEDYSDL